MDKKIGVGVGIMILKDNKILLGLRNPDYKKASSELKGQGTWTMPGGKLDFKESFLDGIIRETKEECNLDLINPKIMWVNNDISGEAHYVTIGFMCNDFSGEVKVMEPDVITEWKWFNLDNLPKNFYMPSKKMVECYLEKKMTVS